MPRQELATTAARTPRKLRQDTVTRGSFLGFTGIECTREPLQEKLYNCIYNCCIYNYCGRMKRSEPSNLHEHLGYWLRCLSNFVSHTFAGRLEHEGVSVAQWVVLRTLYDSTGITLNEAAQRVGVDKSTLSRAIEKLVQKGLASRTDGQDRRSVDLALTPVGRKLACSSRGSRMRMTMPSFTRFPHNSARNSSASSNNCSRPTAGTYCARGRYRME